MPFAPEVVYPVTDDEREGSFSLTIDDVRKDVHLRALYEIGEVDYPDRHEQKGKLYRLQGHNVGSFRITRIRRPLVKASTFSDSRVAPIDVCIAAHAGPVDFIMKVRVSPCLASPRYRLHGTRSLCSDVMNALEEAIGASGNLIDDRMKGNISDHLAGFIDQRLGSIKYNPQRPYREAISERFAVLRHRMIDNKEQTRSFEDLRARSQRRRCGRCLSGRFA